MPDNQTYKVNRILVVDDDTMGCNLMREYLEIFDYQVDVANNGAEGLERFSKFRPDMVFLDLHMPVMSGHVLLNRLTSLAPDIPKVVISGIADISEAMQTVNEGSWDYISKPMVKLDVLRHKIRMAEERATLHRQNHLYREHLEELVAAKTSDVQFLNRQLIDTQKEIVSKLGDVIETRSQETGDHVRRVAQISQILALALGMPKEEADIIRMASPLHDVGKIGIPDSILNKSGKLTEEEFELMKTHTLIGYELLKDADQPIIRTGAIIAQQHHERWDGSGYPNQLSGKDIHIYGRITCLADIYDALRQKRNYKRSWSHEETLSYLKENSGTIFDPDLVRLFFENLHQIEEVIGTYSS